MALSPVPIIAVILILGTARARANGVAFAAGWVLGLVIVSVVILLVAGDADDPDSGTSRAANWIVLVLGALFLVMALKQWRSRPRPSVAPTMPGWMQALDQFRPGKSLGLGAALSGANAKNLALTAAAATAIARAGLDGSETVIAVAIFVVIASVTVVGPVVFYLLAGDRAAGPLASINQFMSDHNAVIMMVVLLILGAKLIGNGLAGLSD